LGEYKTNNSPKFRKIDRPPFINWNQAVGLFDGASQVRGGSVGLE